MMRSKLHGLIALLLASAGCAGDPALDTSPTSQEEYDDVAQAVGTSVARNTGGDAASLTDATTIAVGVLPLGFTVDAEGSIGGDRFGFTYAYDVACWDQRDVPLDHCSHATDRAEVDAAWSGEIDLPRLQADAERTARWVFEDLQLDIAHVEGDSTLALDLAVQPADGPDRTYHFDYAAEYDDVMIFIDERRVVGGVIRYAINAAKTIGGDQVSSFAVDGELVFQPTGRALLVLDGEHQYDVDLSTGLAVRL
jgi:hypothetical protein